MNGDNPFPPIDPNALGTGKCYFIDDLLVPYILARIYLLTSDQMYTGDYEDIVGTQYAFQEVLATLTAGRSCMLGQVVMYYTQNPPVNSLPCDGNIYLRVDYLDLWDVLHADLKIDADHFRVPDLRQRSPKGWQDGTGAVGALQGAAEFELLEENIPEHSHAAIPHSHAITDAGHDHAVQPHNHAVTDPQHSHNIAHTHTFFGRTNGLVPGTSNRTAMADASGANSTPSTQTQSTVASGAAATGIAIQNTTVNVDPATTGIAIDNADAEVDTWGGSGGATIPIPLTPPVTLVQFALICR